MIVLPEGSDFAAYFDKLFRRRSVTLANEIEKDWSDFEGRLFVFGHLAYRREFERMQMTAERISHPSVSPSAYWNSISALIPDHFTAHSRPGWLAVAIRTSWLSIFARCVDKMVGCATRSLAIWLLRPQSAAVNFSTSTIEALGL